jgi:CRISPR-associated endonuclease/helicase Cas3
MTKAERLREMERLYIQHHRRGFADIELAERFGVSRQTVFRDRRELEREMPIIEVAPGRWAIDRVKYLSSIRVNLTEALALYLAARRMSRHTRTHQAHVVSALEKLAATLKQPMTEHLVKMATSIAAQDPQPERLAVLETLVRGWAEHIKVRITHQALSAGRSMTYVISPYLIEPALWSDGTYVIGDSDVHNGLATFKIERIERASLTTERFTLPDDFDEQELFRFAWGIWYSDKKPERVKLRFTGREAIRRLKESVWHPLQEIHDNDDGSCTWEAEVAEPKEMVPWVRGWGADVEVLEPESLRDTLVNEARRLADMYDIQPIPTYQLLWAKTNKGNTQTHSLIHHLIDVAQVTLALWDQSFPEATRRYFAQAMALDQASTRRWLAFVTGLHDLGKACPVFQSQHAASKQTLSRRGLSFEEQRVRVKTPHGLVSAFALQRLLPQRLGLDDDLARQIAHTVGGHHGVFPSARELLRLNSSRRGGEDWDTARVELFEALATLLGVRQLPLWSDTMIDDQTFWTTLAGLTSVADWLGSIEDYFFDLSAPDLDTYADRAYQQASLSLKELGWTGWSPPTQAAGFQELFSFEPRPLQQAIVSLAEQLNSPALVIVEAPTGEGKTEAALHLADHWLQTEQQRGAYVAMPTQATSNQMLGRVQRFLERRYAGQQTELLLLHGNAVWSDDMQSLRLAAIDESSDHTVVAHSWFLPKKRSLLAPFAVGTVDQALMSILQTKHFFVRLFGLAHKTVIFDEIHAYDTYMSTLFQCLLQWLSTMNTTVVLLSATLPERTRCQLMEAYTGRPFTKPVTYPAISWGTMRTDDVFPVETSSTSSRALTIEWIDSRPQALVETLQVELEEGCAAVICNTVGRAQAVYRALQGSQLVPANDLILFHSRFPLHRRKEIETRVLDWFGKDGQQRPKRAIVVATQVIEQSLDLDFDLMISDLAPVDLILQRAGRLHRHVRSERPPRLTIPRLLITIPQMQDDLPQWGSDGLIYEPYVLLRSYLALLNLPTTEITVPTDVQPLIQAVYDDKEPISDDIDQSFRDVLEQTYQEMKRRIDRDRYKARKNLVGAPHTEDVLRADNRQLDEDNPELHETWRAMTRLTRPSVTLVCLHHQADSVTLDSDNRQPIALDEPPTWSLTAKLAERVVTISNYLVVKHFLGQEPPPGWQKHPMLRYHRAAIFTQGRIDLNDFWLILDPQLGIMIESKEG